MSRVDDLEPLPLIKRLTLRQVASIFFAAWVASMAAPLPAIAVGVPIAWLADAHPVAVAVAVVLSLALMPVASAYAFLWVYQALGGRIGTRQEYTEASMAEARSPLARAGLATNS